MGPGWEVLLLRCSDHCILTSPWPAQFLCGEKWHKPCLATSNIQHPTFTHSHRLETYLVPSTYNWAVQTWWWNFLGLGFLGMYFLWGTLQLNSISCDIIMGWMCPWQLWLGPWELSIEGEEVQMWRRGGIHRSQLRAGPGWRWRCRAEIGVLSHLMDYSSTWAGPRQAAAGGRVKGRVLVSVGGIIVTQDTAERIENIAALCRCCS